jgi:hypothetical protein
LGAVWRSPFYTGFMLMKFQISLNIPSYNGKLVHQIIAEHRAESIVEFCQILNDEKFIILEEFYKEKETPNSFATYYSVGYVCINTDWVGKVKEFTV